MKTLNPVSSKKIRHYDDCKTGYPKNYRHINIQNMTSQLRK